MALFFLWDPSVATRCPCVRTQRTASSLRCRRCTRCNTRAVAWALPVSPLHLPLLPSSPTSSNQVQPKRPIFDLLCSSPAEQGGSPNGWRGARYGSLLHGDQHNFPSHPPTTSLVTEDMAPWGRCAHSGFPRCRPPWNSALRWACRSYWHVQNALRPRQGSFDSSRDR
jgi:hypothetical protein